MEQALFILAVVGFVAGLIAFLLLADLPNAAGSLGESFAPLRAFLRTFLGLDVNRRGSDEDPG